MKDKRNCNNQGYPIYQPPMMVPPFGYPANYPNYQGVSNMQPNTYNTSDQQINNLEQQINLLDQRVTRLEKLNNNTNNYNKYNDSNYYMV